MRLQKKLENFMKNRENPLDSKGIFFYYKVVRAKGVFWSAVMR